MRHTLPEQHTISELILEAQQWLAEGPHPERARLDAETLLVHTLEKQNPQRNRAWLLANWNHALLPGAEKRFREFVARRAAGEPIQYILGEAEFYGLPFSVNRDVLIPRPETEHLVEKTLQLAAQFTSPQIVDTGTGSGAIAIALAAHLPTASITATDISPTALALARRNAERNHLAGRIRFVAGDLLVPLADERFQIIVSNPPYVPEEDRASLAVEVRDYEPQGALFAGSDGLAIYRCLIPVAFTALLPGGFLALEIGYGQREAISALLTASGFRDVSFTADLQSIPRVAVAQRP
jgi:release factor glutamine methyltransferase